MDKTLFDKIVKEIVETLQVDSVSSDVGKLPNDIQNIIKEELGNFKNEKPQETVDNLPKEKIDVEPATKKQADNVEKIQTEISKDNDDETNIVVKKGNGLTLEKPNDIGALVRMKARTPARIGVGKAGARLKTSTLLSLRADHAAARDAVFTDVDENVLKEAGLKTFSTVVKDKNEFLTRPDLGKKFTDETLQQIVSESGSGADVLIYASDGLSSTAINANIQNILPVIEDGLKLKGYKVAKPFYVKFGRVGAQDPISEATNATVICSLIGERPGLATAESMSAYITYKATVGMEEARRTVVSNIHKGGTMAIEAGAYIADLIDDIIKAKASGVELKK